MADKMKGKSKPTSSPKARAGKKTDSNLKGNYWKTVDPFIPIVQLDLQRAGDNNSAKSDGYGTKRRKSNPKKNGDWI